MAGFKRTLSIYSYIHSNSNNSVTYFHWKMLALSGIWTGDVPSTKPICYQLSYPGLDQFQVFGDRQCQASARLERENQSSGTVLVSIWCFFTGWWHPVAFIDYYTDLYEIVRHKLSYMQLYKIIGTKSMQNKFRDGLVHFSIRICKVYKCASS